jgi:integrase
MAAEIGFNRVAPMALGLFENAFARSGNRIAFANRFRFEVRPINRGAVTGAWGRARKQIGLGDVHIHDLRRTTGSQLGGDGLGFSDFEIGLVLNHARPSVTAKSYNKGDYAKKKLHMLSAWEARLLAIIEGREPASNVIPLPLAWMTLVP